MGILRLLGRTWRQFAVGESLVLSAVVVVHVIVNVIERRASVADNVNDYVDDYVGCREAALIAKRSLALLALELPWNCA